MSIVSSINKHSIQNFHSNIYLLIEWKKKRRKGERSMKKHTQHFHHSNNGHTNRQFTCLGGRGAAKRNDKEDEDEDVCKKQRKWSLISFVCTRQLTGGSGEIYRTVGKCENIYVRIHVECAANEMNEWANERTNVRWNEWMWTLYKQIDVFLVIPLCVLNTNLVTSKWYFINV